MSHELHLGRREFFGAAAMAIAAAQLGTPAPAYAQSGPGGTDNTTTTLTPQPGTHTSFGPLKQQRAGLLNVGYADAGPANGPVVILLHGWPYDIHSYVDVAPILAAKGYRVIVPFLRGYGTTTFLSSATPRNGQQGLTALDTIALMDVLKIKRAIFGGFDWGSREVAILAALWPERCKGLVAVSGYLITNRAVTVLPLPPKAELGWWYQYYFATENGVLGYTKYRHDFAKLIWGIVSPNWRVTDATFDRTAAAFDNPDHVAIVISDYRWRINLVKGDPQYDQMQAKLQQGPVITVPTITIASDFDGANASGTSYRGKFSGKYAHRVLNGIGHNVPQEAPQAFAQSVIDVDAFGEAVLVAPIAGATSPTCRRSSGVTHMPDERMIDRRSFLSSAAMGATAVQLGITGCARSDDAANTSSKASDSVTQLQHETGSGTNAIRPFPKLNVPDSELSDLRRRITATRWPTRELVADDTQGVRLATTQALAAYWANGYDWRKIEAKLNATPQFVTQIDGVDVHFMHVRSKHDDALPLVMTHGWPGSVIEQMKVIGLLTDPTAHGATTSDAFHLVIPSIPGYGYSGEPAALGWDPIRVAKAWVVLMQRLGYDKFVAQGGDWGASVTQQLAILAPDHVMAIHSNMAGTVPDDILAKAIANAPPPAGLAGDELNAYRQLADFYTHHLGYAVEMSNRPQTLYGLLDSPIGLAAWILDHDKDSYEMIAPAFAGNPGGLSRDDVLDNITMYWLTKTGISSARLYWENKLGFFNVAGVKVPTGVSAFPHEIYTAPKSWSEKAYPKLVYYKKHDVGGHFAAWEQPQLFAEDVRATFRSVRT